MLRLLFFCQSFSVSDPVIADAKQRIEWISRHPDVESIDIVSLRGREKVTDEKIQAHVLNIDEVGKVRGFFKLIYTTWRLLYLKKINVIYIYMAPTLIPVFWPFTKLFNVKIAAWFAHTIYKPVTRFSLKYLCDLWLSVNKQQVLSGCEHVKTLGQGVDNSQFYPQDLPHKYDLITVGRITPVKEIKLMINSLRWCREKYGKYYTMAICGDSYTSEDIAYKEELIKKVNKEGMENQVFFLGSISRKDLPSYICSSKAFLFAVPGGVGKAAVESMACATPVVFAQNKLKDFLGEELSQYLEADFDVETLGKKIHEILSLDEKEYNKLAQSCYQLIHDYYTFEAFTERLVGELKRLV